jgi:hypothetical protein
MKSHYNLYYISQVTRSHKSVAKRAVLEDYKLQTHSFNIP